MSARGFTGADGAVQQLEALGVSTIFGIPGVHNLALFEALDRSPIRTVLVRHELTAVFASDGYARSSGRLGVAVTTTGPGAANTAGAMGEARAARSPVLQLSTQLPTALLSGRSGRGGLHESPHQRELMAAVGTWSERVATAAAIPQMIGRAAAAAFEGRRGPAFLEIPFDLLDEEIGQRSSGARIAAGLEPDTKQLARAAKLLRAASSPVIWSGGGAVSSDAADAVRALAEALDAPVITTYSGRGILPSAHALTVGMPAHEPAVTAMLEASDAIVIVGSDLDSMNTMGWRLDPPHPRISINTVVDDARRNYAADVAIEADARATIEALLPMLPRRSSGKGTTPGAKRAAAAVRTATKRLTTSATFAPGFAFARTVTDAASAVDARVVCDMAVGAYWVAGYGRFDQPRLLSYPMGWGTLGFSIPAAVGVAAGGARALVVCGDAGAMYAIGELATYVQEQLDVCVLIVDDGGYGMLRFDEDQTFGRQFASDLVTPDLVALAGAFGVPARKATSKGLAGALAWGLKQRGPAVIVLRAAFAPPPTTSPRWPRIGEPERRP
jgi:acetolactate synthase-1/2/3 large subunit